MTTSVQITTIICVTIIALYVIDGIVKSKKK